MGNNDLPISRNYARLYFKDNVESTNKLLFPSKETVSNPFEQITKQEISPVEQFARKNLLKTLYDNYYAYEYERLPELRSGNYGADISRIQRDAAQKKLNDKASILSDFKNCASSLSEEEYIRYFESIFGMHPDAYEMELDNNPKFFPKKINFPEMKTINTTIRNSACGDERIQETQGNVIAQRTQERAAAKEGFTEYQENMGIFRAMSSDFVEHFTPWTSRKDVIESFIQDEQQISELQKLKDSGDYLSFNKKYKEITGVDFSVENFDKLDEAQNEYLKNHYAKKATEVLGYLNEKPKSYDLGYFKPHSGNMKMTPLEKSLYEFYGGGNAKNASDQAREWIEKSSKALGVDITRDRCIEIGREIAADPNKSKGSAIEKLKKDLPESATGEQILQYADKIGIDEDDLDYDNFPCEISESEEAALLRKNLENELYRRLGYPVALKKRYETLESTFRQKMEEAKKEAPDYAKNIDESRKEYEKAARRACGKNIPQETLNNYTSNVETTYAVGKMVVETAAVAAVTAATGGTGTAAAVAATATKGARTAVAGGKLLRAGVSLARTGATAAAASFSIDCIDKGHDGLTSDEVKENAIEAAKEGLMFAAAEGAVKGVSKGIRYTKTRVIPAINEHFGRLDSPHLKLLQSKQTVDYFDAAVRLDEIEELNSLRVAKGAKPLNLDFDTLAYFTTEKDFEAFKKFMFVEGRGAQQFSEGEVLRLMRPNFRLQCIDGAEKFGLFDYKAQSGKFLSGKQIEKFGHSTPDIAFSKLPQGYSTPLEAYSADMAALKAGKTSAVCEFKAGTSVEQAFKSTKVGDAVQIGDKMFINNGEVLEPWNMTRKVFDDLFPLGERFSIKQGNIGDCFFLDEIGADLLNPEARTILYRNIKLCGKDIHISTKSRTTIFKNGEIKFGGVLDHADACKGIQMYEQAYANSCLQGQDPFLQFSPTSLDSSAEIEAAMEKISHGGYMSDVNKELLHLSSYGHACSMTADLDWYLSTPWRGTASFSNDSDAAFYKLIEKFANDPNSILSFGTHNSLNFYLRPGARIVSNHAHNILGYNPQTKMVLINQPHCWTKTCEVPIDSLKKLSNALSITKLK